MVSSKWATLLIFKIVYFLLLLIFSFLSTSVVVYTIASIYASRDVDFNTIMSIVPKVWKKLKLTFFCTFVVFFFYHFVAAFVFITCLFTFGFTDTGIEIYMIIAIIYFGGILHLSVIWQLANVVFVLEESHGFDAMMKSKDLIKGKMGLPVLVFLKLNVSFVVIWYVFKKVVVHGWSLNSLDGTTYGFLCFLLSHLILFMLVLQTMLYFLCHSYHHQNIDKSTLSNHLEVYLGEYEPLKTKDVQLEQYQV